MRRFIIALGLVCLLVMPAAAINDDAWGADLGDWDYRIPITITNAPTTAEVQQEITVEYKEHMQADFDDLRFYTASGTQIDFWVEEYTVSTSADVWIKLPSADMQYIYVYYGNSAASDLSNPDRTFVFYDGFEGESIDTDKWTIHAPTCVVSGGSVYIPAGVNPALVSKEITTLDSDYITEFSTKYTLTNDKYFMMVLNDDEDNRVVNAIYHLDALRNCRASHPYLSIYDTIIETYYKISLHCHSDAVGWDCYVNDVLCGEGLLYDNTPYANNIEFSTASTAYSNPGYVDWVWVRKYNSANTILSFGTPEYLGGSTPTPTPTPGLPHATLQARSMASATVAPLDDVGYYLLNSALGLNEQYNESAGTGELNPRGVFNASMYPFTGGDYGDYASLLIFAVPFLLAWMRQNSAIIPMSFGCILGTWMLWKLPAEWQMPATGLIILSMMGILYGIYKEKF